MTGTRWHAEPLRARADVLRLEAHDLTEAIEALLALTRQEA